MYNWWRIRMLICHRSDMLRSFSVNNTLYGHCCFYYSLALVVLGYRPRTGSSSHIPRRSSIPINLHSKLRIQIDQTSFLYWFDLGLNLWVWMPNQILRNISKDHVTSPRHLFGKWLQQQFVFYLIVFLFKWHWAFPIADHDEMGCCVVRKRQHMGIIRNYRKWPQQKKKSWSVGRGSGIEA